LKLAISAKNRKVSSAARLKKIFRDKLGNLEREYGWLAYDFADKTGWDVNYFAKLVLKKTKVDIWKRLDYLNDYDRRALGAFNKAALKLRLNAREKRLFRLISYLGYYKWVREYEFLKAMYNLKFVDEELGRRAGLSSIQSKYISAEEFKRYLSIKPGELKNIAKKRMKNFLIIVEAGKETKMKIGMAAIKGFAKIKFVGDEIGKNTSTLKGSPAQAGKTKGIVKIINTAKDCVKMNKGDILISQATSPDMILAMKKAAAIVTNEGGITCHAAIVSRELGIPCITGTKIATKVLRDGMTVEVDADQGIIKIIK